MLPRGPRLRAGVLAVRAERQRALSGSLVPVPVYLPTQGEVQRCCSGAFPGSGCAGRSLASASGEVEGRCSARSRFIARDGSAPAHPSNSDSDREQQRRCEWPRG